VPGETYRERKKRLNNQNNRRRLENMTAAAKAEMARKKREYWLRTKDERRPQEKARLEARKAADPDRYRMAMRRKNKALSWRIRVDPVAREKVNALKRASYHRKRQDPEWAARFEARTLAWRKANPEKLARYRAAEGPRRKARRAAKNKAKEAERASHNALPLVRGTGPTLEMVGPQPLASGAPDRPDVFVELHADLGRSDD
jgi:hypothetical protein